MHLSFFHEGRFSVSAFNLGGPAFWMVGRHVKWVMLAPKWQPSMARRHGYLLCHAGLCCPWPGQAVFILQTSWVSLDCSPPLFNVIVIVE